jgi:hypothetical protein
MENGQRLKLCFSFELGNSGTPVAFLFGGNNNNNSNNKTKVVVVVGFVPIIIIRLGLSPVVASRSCLE